MSGTFLQGQARRAQIFLITGFVLLGFLLILAIWFDVLLSTDTNRVEAASATRALLIDTFVTVQQAETGQRGYLLTGNLGYLAPYQTAIQDLPAELQALREKNNGLSPANLTTLQSAIAAKTAELARTIAMYQAGDQAGAIALVKSNIGKSDMDRIQTLIVTMRAEQGQLRTKIETNIITTTWLFQATAYLSVVGMLLLALFTLRENRAQTNQVLILDRELNRVFNLSNDILAVSDASGSFITLSPAWTRITGHPVEGGLGTSFHGFVHPDDLQPAIAALTQPFAEGRAFNFETRLHCADGAYRWLSWRTVPLPEEGLAYSIGRDVTEEKEQAEHLRQSQKMEVIGQLTGGIAHDFNNLLTIIMGSLELLQRGMVNADPKHTRRIETAMEGARRAAALTHRMLAFARRQPLAPQNIDPNRLLSGMSEILHRTLGEPVALELVCAAGLWRVLADGHQLENAILNLAVNARDAMQSGGHLTIETQNSFLDDAYVAKQSGVTPGQYVLIAVTDTGEGMSPATMAKVFEPFFTTKPVGTGTGLGLAQVYGFVKQSNGHVKIYSEPGHGTTVKLYLPRAQGSKAEPPAMAAEHPGDLASRGETILVVEDEADVRNFTIEVLREFGYQVIGTENATTALPVIASNQRIDLMFTDIVLTGHLNGRQIADILLRQRPGTPVLFTTGYTRNAIIHNGRLDEGTEFLSKPFSATALAQKIRTILDRLPSHV
jgi:PAS domain S-box-containing protein